MKIDVIISANHIKQEDLRGKVVVVIDILRATSVIITALGNGAKRIIPLLTVEEAFKKAEDVKCLEKSVVLGGERKALKIERFDCSNSPLEYTKSTVANKTVIITTTNGTRALNLCLDAKKIFVGAMINGKAIVNKLLELNQDVVFVNAGTNGEFSIDDFICAGYMINLLTENKSCQLTDIAKTSEFIYRQNKDITSFIKEATHYEILKGLGLEKDLEYCCSKDILDIVPYFDDGNIII